jgi:L-rhamnose mutarotase
LSCFSSEKGEENVENSLLVKTDASFAMNFLIYIQNIFLNQNRKEGEVTFPYLPSRIIFNEHFESKYNELWNEVSQKIADDHINGASIFYEEKNLFYERLFPVNSTGLKDFSEIYKAFDVWWNSFAGRFAAERSVDEAGEKLYSDLAASLIERGIKPEQELHISLIYDKCVLADAKVLPYYAVIPIKDFFVNYEELVQKLLKHI